ncbi:phosphoheptose isomerase [bacterium]|nr:phosphoheptose isomerase [bacterium]
MNLQILGETISALMNKTTVNGKPPVVSKDTGVFLIGNGASSAIASHGAADLLKKGYNARTLTDPAVLTCFANDFGYELALLEQLERLMKPNDLVIAISSSGMSKNILAAIGALNHPRQVMTLTAFKKTNDIRAISSFDYRIHVPTHSYALAETCHAAILHAWIDDLEGIR